MAGRVRTFAIAAVILINLVPPHMAGLAQDFIASTLNRHRPQLQNYYREKIEMSELTLNNVTVQGMDQFTLLEVDVTLFPLKLNNLTLTFDIIHAESQYIMQEMNLPGEIVLSGAGDIVLTLSQLRISIQGTLGSKRRKIFFKDITQIEVKVNAAEIFMTGIEGGGPVGDFIAQVINSSAKPTINNILPKFLMENKEKLIVAVNEFLLETDL